LADDYFCAVMIGYAVRSRRLWAPEAMTDPFRNHPKGEQRGYAVVAREKVMKEKEMPNLDIVKATFGETDVTEQVKSLYAEGQRVFRPDAEVWGKNLSDGVKKLTIEYSKDGEQVKPTAAEGTFITVQDGPPK
jgi:hypothetical protein